MSFEIVPSLAQASERDYVELFDRSFGGDAKLSEQFLTWEYRENPDGGAIGADAYSGERLAAHYSVMPRGFIYDGRRILGALSVNTATHPDFQGNGLFTKLAERTYADCAARGVKLVVGVANAASVGGFVRKLGFTDLGNVRLGIGVSPIKAPTGALATDRSDTWWRWRMRNPSRTYALAGRALQTEVHGVSFAIADASAIPADALPQVRRTMLRTRVALTPVFPVPSGVPVLPRMFQPSPWHVIIRALDGAPVEDYARNLVLWGIDMDTF